MIGVKGNEINDIIIGRDSNIAAICDKNYQVIGNNIDPTICAQILNHEYVDFSRLLPKDKMTKIDDHCIE